MTTTTTLKHAVLYPVKAHHTSGFVVEEEGKFYYSHTCGKTACKFRLRVEIAESEANRLIALLGGCEKTEVKRAG